MENQGNGSRRNKVLGVQDVGDAVNEIYCVPPTFTHSLTHSK